jgi:hypothetical protein
MIVHCHFSNCPRIGYQSVPHSIDTMSGARVFDLEGHLPNSFVSTRAVRLNPYRIETAESRRHTRPMRSRLEVHVARLPVPGKNVWLLFLD